MAQPGVNFDERGFGMLAQGFGRLVALVFAEIPVNNSFAVAVVIEDKRGHPLMSVAREYRPRHHMNFGTKVTSGVLSYLHMELAGLPAAVDEGDGDAECPVRVGLGTTAGRELRRVQISGFGFRTDGVRELVLPWSPPKHRKCRDR